MVCFCSFFSPNYSVSGIINSGSNNIIGFIDWFCRAVWDSGDREYQIMVRVNKRIFKPAVNLVEIFRYSWLSQEQEDIKLRVGQALSKKMMVCSVAELDSVEANVRAEAREEDVAISISFAGVTIASDEDCSTW